MKEMQTDILIVGGGLSGLTSALALSSSGKDIIVIDCFDFINIKKNNLDLRTTAISEGSKQFFDKLQIWKKIAKFAEPIKKISVIDRKKPRNINFVNSLHAENLGYIVRNLIIKEVLIKKIKLKKNIILIKNKKIKGISYLNNYIFANTDTLNIKASLLIAADGKKSGIRKIKKTPTYKKEYSHSALVVNFHHKKNHNGIAHELFYKNGPLAILPMKKNNKNYYTSSVIWSNSKDYLGSLIKSSNTIFSSILEEKIFNFVGEIQKIVDTQIFDLSAHINIKFYEERIVYIGDAAHSLHPIAGQGWNLGVKDIKNLSHIVKKNISLGMDLGNSNLCKNFHDIAFKDAFLLYQITNNLNKIFMNDSFLIDSIRRNGFSFIERKPKLKKLITNYAMGV